MTCVELWWVLGLVVGCSGSSRLGGSTPVPSPTTAAPAVRAKAGMTLDARGPIVSYATSSDGRLVAAVTMTEVVVWDVVGATEVVAYPREREPFGDIHLAFTRDASHLVVASGQHVDRFAVTGTHEVTALGLPPAQSIWFVPGGEHLVANLGTQVELWATAPLHRVP